MIPSAPNLEFEGGLWDAGLDYIAGVDEAGRGALAGPVAAAAVILPSQKCIAQDLQGVRDSKEMSPAQRASWALSIRAVCLTFGVGFASSEEIDLLGIIPATRLAAQRAIKMLTPSPLHLLLDYLFIPDTPLPQTSLIKGDARSLSIAAASVLAKTSRDAVMCEMDERYPGYGFAGHKGYGTQAHRQAIEVLGPTFIHRMTFAPMRHKLCH
ncbi:MAG: ribonuclease HII [Chloroflexi bacterium]|nr:ribonuclease HII [Chloroflexota bacterium]